MITRLWGRFRETRAGVLGSPNFPIVASLGLHGVSLLAAALAWPTAPAQPREPPPEPVQIAFEQPRFFAPIFSDPVELDAPLFETPVLPLLDTDDVPSDEIEGIDHGVIGEINVPPAVDRFLLPPREISLSVFLPPCTPDPEPEPGDVPSGSNDPSETGVATAPPEPLRGGNRPPRYPSLARRQGYEGRVLLEINVSADGTVERVTVIESSGYPVLDEAAAAAVRIWRFSPARAGKVAVASRARIAVRFVLAQTHTSG